MAYNLLKTLEQRKQGKGKRNDLIDMMLEAIKKTEENKEINHMDETMVIATALVILVAGYDTTATTMSYIFYQMAMQPHIQVKYI